jgi:signal transduction histidine kinase
MLEWLRPDRRQDRSAAMIATDAVVTLVFLWITVESLRSTTFIEEYGRVEGAGWLLAVSPTALLLVRRLAPATTMFAATALLMLASVFWGDSNAPLAIPFFAYSVGLTRPANTSAWMIGVAALALAMRVLYGPGDPILLAVPVTLMLYAIGWLVAVSIRRNQERAGRFATEAQELRIHSSEIAEQAVADERARIARELHDAVGHAVNLMVMQAGAIRLTTRDARVAQALRELEDVGRSALTDLDRMLGLLRSPEGNPAPLEPARTTADIAKLIDEARRSGVDVHLHNRCDDAMGEAMERPAGAAAYRIVQEALTNAIKHAGPARIDVTIACTERNVEVTVADNGRGIRANAAPGGGRGIVGMTERAHVLGGTLTAGPLAEGGFQVNARIPRTAKSEHATASGRGGSPK